MWHFIGVAVTGLVGTGVGVGYYLLKVAEHEKE
jgi:hypothetical protein